MIDFARCDPRLLDVIDHVVDELKTRASIDPASVMLVGAQCRDVIHSALGHTAVLRLTEDTDIAIAMSDWQTFDRIAETFAKYGDTGVGYRVGGVKVDILPFGAVEDPDGIVAPRQHGEDMVVFGFDDVFARSEQLRLPSGTMIRIPAIAGYVALKLRAFIDRWPIGQDKDSKDLAAALFWYFESPVVRDRLWGSAQTSSQDSGTYSAEESAEDGLAVLEDLDWDQDLGAARLLGRDVREQLTAENTEDLVARWRSVDREFLSRTLELPAGIAWTRDRARRLALIDEVLAGLAGA